MTNFRIPRRFAASPAAAVLAPRCPRGGWKGGGGYGAGAQVAWKESRRGGAGRGAEGRDRTVPNSNESRQSSLQAHLTNGRRHRRIAPPPPRHRAHGPWRSRTGRPALPSPSSSPYLFFLEFLIPPSAVIARADAALQGAYQGRGGQGGQGCQYRGEASARPGPPRPRVRVSVLTQKFAVRLAIIFFEKCF